MTDAEKLGNTAVGDAGTKAEGGPPHTAGPVASETDPSPSLTTSVTASASKSSKSGKAKVAAKPKAFPTIPKEMLLPIIGPAPLLPPASSDSSPPSTSVVIPGITKAEIAAIGKLRVLLSAEQNAIRRNSSQGVGGAQDGRSGGSPSPLASSCGKVSGQTESNPRQPSGERSKKTDKNAEDAAGKEPGKEQFHGEVPKAVGVRDHVDGSDSVHVGKHPHEGTDSSSGAGISSVEAQNKTCEKTLERESKGVGHVLDGTREAQAPSTAAGGSANTGTDTKRPSLSAGADGQCATASEKRGSRSGAAGAEHRSGEQLPGPGAADSPTFAGASATTLLGHHETGAHGKSDSPEEQLGHAEPSLGLPSPTGQQSKSSKTVKSTEEADAAKGKTKSRSKMSVLKSGMKSLMSTGKLGKSTTPSLMKPHLTSPLTDFEWWWCDEKCLLRFLRARDLNIKKAFLLLIDTIKFRREKMPHLVSPVQVEDLNKEGHLYRLGFDKEGRAILMMWPTEESIKAKDEAQVKNIMYHLERAVASMGVDQAEQQQDSIVFVVNYASFTAANQPPMSVTRSFLDIFSLHYPERLHKAFIVDAPWYFNTFWSVVSPLVPIRTKEKIDFIDTTNPEHIKRIHEQIPAELLPCELGGPGTYVYDHQKYWANEKLQYTAWFDFMKKKFNPNRPGGNTATVTNRRILDGTKESQAAAAGEAEVGGKESEEIAELVAEMDDSDEGASVEEGGGGEDADGGGDG